MTERGIFSFRLFVAGDAPNSAQALSNLTALCDRFLPGRYEIEVVDVYRDAARALAEGIFMTPTLVRLCPGAVLKVVGSLSNSETVVAALGLVAA